jgi:hypothetical protein
LTVDFLGKTYECTHERKEGDAHVKDGEVDWTLGREKQKMEVPNYCHGI